MKTVTDRFASLLLAVAVCVAGSALAPAGAQTSIRLLINDEPITNYDISQRLKMMQIGREKASEKAAIEHLIDETLQIQEGKKRGLAVSDKQVDAYFADIAQKNKMSPAQFTAALAQGGLAATTIKRFIRAQSTWGQLVQGKAKATNAIKSKDITDAMFAKEGESKLTIKEYKLQQIIFIVPKAKSSPAYIAQRRREAEAFRGRFGGCGNSLALARSLKDVVVKDIGRRDSSQLDGQLGDDIKAAGVGKTSRPQQTGQGIELLAVCDARDIQSDAEARAAAESKLLIEQSKGLGEDYLKQIRKAAIIVYR